MQDECNEENNSLYECTDLRDVNEKTHMYEERPKLRDVNKISECLALFVSNPECTQACHLIKVMKAVSHKSCSFFFGSAFPSQE